MFLVVSLTSLDLLPGELKVDLLKNKHLGGKFIPLGLHPLDFSHQHVALFLQLTKYVLFIRESLRQHAIQHLFVDTKGLLKVCLFLRELFVLVL